jgi:hypothetical protein
MTEQVKHTPGPWTVTRLEDGLFMCHTIGDTVCFGDPNHVEPDDSANFRLIAAAPEMYAALCAVLSDTDELDLDLLADMSPQTARLIHAALAKAEGKAVDHQSGSASPEAVSKADGPHA